MAEQTVERGLKKTLRFARRYRTCAQIAVANPLASELPGLDGLNAAIGKPELMAQGLRYEAAPR